MNRPYIKDEILYLPTIDSPTIDELSRRIDEKTGENIAVELAQKTYNAESRVEFFDYSLVRKSIYGSNENATLVNNNNRLTTSKPIPIEPYTRFLLSSTSSNYCLFVATGVKDLNNNFIFHRTYSVTPNHPFIVTGGDNYIIVTLYNNNGSRLEESEVSNFTFTACHIFTSKFPIEKLENEFVKSPVLYVSDYTKFVKLGIYNGVTNINQNTVLSLKPIKVIPGHRYIFNASAANAIVQMYIWGMETINDTEAQMIPSHAGLMWNDNIHFDCPNGINYIKLQVIGEVSITAEQANTANICMIDVTTSGFYEGIDKVLTRSYVKAIDVSHYCQGSATYGNYYFLTFADGTIDVFNCITWDFVQQITLPKINGVPLHCGSISFGVKYDQSDNLPLLWISGNGSTSANNPFYAIRFSGEIGNLTASILYTVNSPDNGEQYFDIKNKRLLTIRYLGNESYTDNYFNTYMLHGDMLFTLYDVSSWDNTATYTQISQMRQNHTYPFQGGILKGNDFYLCTGREGGVVNQHPARIYKYNLISGKMVNALDFNRFEYELGNDVSNSEIQSITTYGGKLIISFVHGTFILNH